MPRLSTLVLAFFIGAFFGKVTQAQVLQPTYVRPSKGAAVQILAMPANSPTFTYAPSAIFDWTAFAGVIVTVNAPTPTPPNTACKYGVRVKAFGGTNTVRSDFFLLNVANNVYQANTSQAWYIRVLPGYLYFQMESYEADLNPATPACAGNFRVSITPLPFDYAGQLTSTGVVGKVVPGGGNDPVVYADAAMSSSQPYMRIQNFSTVSTLCTPILNDGSTPSGGIVNWPIRLKAASDTYAGDGGVIEINGWVGTIRCAGTIGVFAH